MMPKDAVAKPRVSLPVFLLGAAVLIGVVYAIGHPLQPQAGGPDAVAERVEDRPVQPTQPHPAQAATADDDTVQYDPKMVGHGQKIEQVGAVTKACVRASIIRDLSNGERSRTVMANNASQHCSMGFVQLGDLGVEGSHSAVKLITLNMMDEVIAEQQ